MGWCQSADARQAFSLHSHKGRLGCYQAAYGGYDAHLSYPN